MSFINPSAHTRRNITFYAQLLQAAAIILGGGWALWSYENQLEAPYDSKQLNLYLEAAKVLTDLAILPTGADHDKAEQRFWELYWGQLAFVESRTADKDKDSIEAKMATFCGKAFKDVECHYGTSTKPLVPFAFDFSRKASDEIQGHWKPWRSWFRWFNGAASPAPSAQSLPSAAIPHAPTPPR